jgi:hypothetical protein
MTFERKIIVGLEDITAVILECKNEKCKKRILHQLNAGIDIPILCTCQRPWLAPAVIKIRETDSPLFNFINLISPIRSLTENDAIGFKILLQFDEPGLKL